MINSDIIDLQKEPADINTETGPENTLELTINDTTYRLSQSQANNLNKQIEHTTQLVNGAVKPEPILKLARKRSTYNEKNNPWHIKGEYGCHHSDTVSGQIEELNLVDLASEPVYNEQYNNWTTAGRDTPMSFERYFNLFVCHQCEKHLQYWHTQRRIFLGELITKLDLSSINRNTFTDHATHQCACDMCGTPNSGISKLLFEATVHGAEGPFLLCPTCRDLLIIGTDSNPPVEKLPLSSHPHQTDLHSPDTPITDPDFTPPAQRESTPIPLSQYSDLEKTEFVTIVSDFPNVSTGTAERLYNNGFDSIPELATATKTSLTDISLVGPATATNIQQAANELLTP